MASAWDTSLQVHIDEDAARATLHVAALALQNKRADDATEVKARLAGKAALLHVAGLKEAIKRAVPASAVEKASGVHPLQEYMRASLPRESWRERVARLYDEQSGCHNPHFPLQCCVPSCVDHDRVQELLEACGDDDELLCKGLCSLFNM